MTAAAQSPPQTMKWASAISTQTSLEAAVQEVAAQATAQLGEVPDLAIVFVSTAFASEYTRLLPLLRQRIQTPHVVGCSSSGVIGMQLIQTPLEAENQPALSLSLAVLPGVEVMPFHLTAEALPDLDSPPAQWTELMGVDPTTQPHFILMADPFSAGTNELLQGMDFAYPGAVKVGGLAGIDNFSRSSGLFCGEQLHREGIVGVALSGRIVIEAIVAQGCRPIGPVYRVVERDRNIILNLEALDDPEGSRSQTPLELLQGVFHQLSESDRALAQQSLFIGIAQSGFKSMLKRGDFLIRNLLGIDPRNGAIAIADKIRPGMRIQFHLRDAQTSAEDLDMLLAQYQLENMERPSPVGSLLFACTGRGEGLYEEPNFDSGLFQHHLGSVPLSGFFCNGEIGPIGGTTFLHGFTSVFGICREPG